MLAGGRDPAQCRGSRPLSLVLCADRAPVGLAAARAAGPDVGVVLVWFGPGEPPFVSGAVVVRAFPAGRAHARNRGAAAAGAPVLAFLDAGAEIAPGWAVAVLDAVAAGAGAVVVGALLAVRRDRFEEVGGFDVRLGPGAFGRTGDDLELLERLRRRGARVVEGSSPARATAFDAGFGAGRGTRRLASPRVAKRFVGGLGGRPAGEVAGAVAGLAAGALLSDRWRSPPRLLDAMPGEIRGAVGDRRLRGRPVPHRPDPHFLWWAGENLVLHAYAEPPEDAAGALAARHAAREAGVPGVPAARAAAEGAGGWWVLEERLPGRSAAREGGVRDRLRGRVLEARRSGRSGGNRAGWWSEAADWATRLATAGAARPLRESAWGREAVPESRVLDRIGDLPAVPVHGDLQPKNLLLDRTGRLSGVLDWERAIPEGPPGLDLLFLVLAARAPGDRPGAVRALGEGRDPPGTPVLARLERTGVDPVVVPDLLTLAVALWVADEHRRRSRLGTFPPPATDQGLARLVMTSA